MEYEWGRFVYWLSQGQNAAAVQAIAALGGLTASVLLTAITAWYAWLTKHILVASTLQALDEMRPELNLLVQPTERLARVRIHNAGKYGALLLDVRLTRYIENRPMKQWRLADLQGRLFKPNEQASFAVTVPDATDQPSGFEAYDLVVVASDRAKHIFITYDYRSHANVFLIEHGRPSRIRLRLLLNPWRIRYWNFANRLRKSSRR
jgi:hypothetical protein